MRTSDSFAHIGTAATVRCGAAVLLAAMLTGCAASASTPTTAPTAVAQQANVAAPRAPKPANVALKIVSPNSGEIVDAGQLKVAIDYSGPALVPAAQASKIDDYHLHYFLDEDATPYIGTSVPIPAGRPTILHTAAREVTFDHVSAGTHTVAVVMAGNNHVSVEAPVSDTVAFTAR